MTDISHHLNDFLDRALRQKWYFLVPFMVLFATAIAVALLLPPVYQSTATIAIEDPDVPDELVESTIASVADKRLQLINQRVMATDNLLNIIRSYDLYAEARQEQPITDVVELMRENILMELIRTDTTRRSQSTEAPVIAFTVSFMHRNPEIAQRVANELTSLYLSENVRERQAKADETADFLATEARRLEQTIIDIEKQLADLKTVHGGSLPEQQAYNLQSISRAEQELRDLDRRAQSLNERQVYLQSQLSQISPYGSYTVDGERVLSPGDRLKALRTQLASISGQYSRDHPDVVKMRREIQGLERQQGGGPSAADFAGELQRVESELALARQKYTADHPEVARLQREAAGLRASMATASRSPATAAAPDNPAYIQLQAQLQAAQSEFDAIAAQQKAVRERMTQFEGLIEKSPDVDRDYQRLMRALTNASAEYRDIRAKEMAANLGRSLETERKSEKFTLIEPPLLPTSPYSPNRLAITAIGFVLSVIAGIAIALLRDMFDSAVYSPHDVRALTGVAPLAIIPYMRTRADVLRAWQWRSAIGFSALALIVGSALVVHFFVLPLDVVWAALERRV
jgi:protein tyrosine kinase modulator